MGKRASIGSKGTVSPEKAPRIEKMATQDPLLVACQPMFKVIRASVDAEISSAEMLCAALPFALRQPEGAEKRHKFQERILRQIKHKAQSFMRASPRVSKRKWRRATKRNRRTKSSRASWTTPYSAWRLRGRRLKLPKASGSPCRRPGKTLRRA